jgi:hypothetical protein
MCSYQFLYIFYKQEIKHCLMNVSVNISALSDLKLPASLEMLGILIGWLLAQEPHPMQNCRDAVQMLGWR